MSKTVTMGALAAATYLAFAGAALAQNQPPASDIQQLNEQSKSEHSTGRTTSPETLGQKQPQGWTGPITTTTGGAPASSPQGQTPPGMQAAPEGSDKTIVAPENEKK